MRLIISGAAYAALYAQRMAELAQQPPTAVADAVFTPEETPVTINVISNDASPDGSPLSVTALTVPPIYGGAIINIDQTITYTPPPEFNGTDTFTYEITNGNGLTDTAEVTVTVGPVNDAPIANDDWATMSQGGTITLTPITNDYDYDGDTLTITDALVDPSEGVATFTDTEITFTPEASFTGDAYIIYSITDGHLATNATITVTVNADGIPIVTDDVASTYANTAVDLSPLLNDSHTTGDTFYIQTASVGATEGVLSYTGSVITYTPATGFTGDAIVSYTVTDSNGDTASGTITVTVNPTPVPTAVDDTFTMDQDTSATIDVVSNDTHATDTLTVSGPIVVSGSGTAVMSGNDITFTPTAGWFGTAEIEYLVTDENTNSDVGLLTVTVNEVVAPANDPFDDPVAAEFALMVDGSTGGVGKSNANLWSNKEGIDGSTDGTEWRTITGTRDGVQLTIADDPTVQDYWVRCRFKVSETPTAKVYVHFTNEWMDDYSLWADITNDATPDASRIMSNSANISDATAAVHPTNGWVYVKFRLNFSTASDTVGTNLLEMADNWNGDLLMDNSALTVVRTQDYSFEPIT